MDRTAEHHIYVMSVLGDCHTTHQHIRLFPKEHTYYNSRNIHKMQNMRNINYI